MTHEPNRLPEEVLAKFEVKETSRSVSSSYGAAVPHGMDKLLSPNRVWLRELTTLVKQRRIEKTSRHIAESFHILPNHNAASHFFSLNTSMNLRAPHRYNTIQSKCLQRNPQRCPFLILNISDRASIPRPDSATTSLEKLSGTKTLQAS